MPTVQSKTTTPSYLGRTTQPASAKTATKAEPPAETAAAPELPGLPEPQKFGSTKAKAATSAGAVGETKGLQVDKVKTEFTEQLNSFRTDLKTTLGQIELLDSAIDKAVDRYRTAFPEQSKTKSGEPKSREDLVFDIKFPAIKAGGDVKQGEILLNTEIDKLVKSGDLPEFFAHADVGSKGAEVKSLKEFLKAEIAKEEGDPSLKRAPVEMVKVPDELTKDPEAFTEGLVKEYKVDTSDKPKAQKRKVLKKLMKTARRDKKDQALALSTEFQAAKLAKEHAGKSSMELMSADFHEGSNSKHVDADENVALETHEGGGKAAALNFLIDAGNGPDFGHRTSTMKRENAKLHVGVGDTGKNIFVVAQLKER